MASVETNINTENIDVNNISIDDNNCSNEKNEFTLTNNTAITLINFYKIFKDLIIDLNNCFSDKVSLIIQNNKDYQNIINYCLPDFNDDINVDEYVNSLELESLNKDFMLSLNNVYEYCKRTFAVRSIDILYQNEDIFLNKKEVTTENNTPINTMFLPDIEFSELYYDDTSDQTKQTLWKYLQLILFNIITSIDDISFFGDSLELLKIIDSDKFSTKIQSTIDEISKMFSFKDVSSDSSNNLHQDKDQDQDQDNLSSDLPDLNNMFDKMFSDLSSNMEFTHDVSGANNQNDYNIPDKEELFSHINKLVNGKIGSLAKEIAEETTKDLDIDGENINDVNDVLKGFMKNPTKLLGLINNISNKINTKMKDGSLKESELLEEATNIFKDMKNVPGMGNFNDIFKSMNLDQFMPKGGKINPNAFQSMMEQNVKMSKMRERMKKKAESKAESSTMNYSQNYDAKPSNNTTSGSNDNIKLDDLNANLSSLMEQMQNNTSFIDQILKQQGQKTKSNNNESGEKTERSKAENAKRKSNNKKKVNKKK